MIFCDDYQIKITGNESYSSTNHSCVKPIVALFQAVLVGAIPLLVGQKYRFRRSVQILTGIAFGSGVFCAYAKLSSKTVKERGCTVTVSWLSTTISGCHGDRIDLEKNGKKLFWVIDNPTDLTLYVPLDRSVGRLTINGHPASVRPGGWTTVIRH